MMQASAAAMYLSHKMMKLVQQGLLFGILFVLPQQRVYHKIAVCEPQVEFAQLHG
jgi:hypothetical protein